MHVDGRRGDLIITGGENVWPEAVEAILTSHPAVADAMVRGVDDDEWGQVVEAVVVPRGTAPTLDTIRAYVKASHPAFIAPRSIRIVDALPAPRSANSAATRTLERRMRDHCAHVRRTLITPFGTVQALGATPAPPSIT